MVFNAASGAAIKSGKKQWAWKFGLRLASLIISLIGIGCVAGALSTPSNQAIVEVAFSLIPLGCGVIWNAITLAVLVSRKRPVYPGVAVGLDLILWLSLIPAGYFATTAPIYTQRWYLSDSYTSVRGHWGDDANGVYRWIPDDVPCYGFNSCVEQDAVLARRRRLVRLEYVAVACIFVAVILHMALFVWACIDTRALKSTRVQSKARQTADVMFEEEMEPQGQVQPAGRPLSQAELAPGPEPLVMTGGARTLET